VSSLFVIVSLVVIGGLLETKIWSWPAEKVRLIAVAAALCLAPAVVLWCLRQRFTS